jgi:hypothetical protein
MFAEKSKILDLNRIKNLTEFGINIKECTVEFSRNKNYAIIYTDEYLAITNLDKKTVESKYSNDKNGRISKVKFLGRSITYLNQKDNLTHIVITNLGSLGEYYEYTTNDVLLDYLYIESDGLFQDCLLTVNSKGDISAIRDLKKVKSVNIVKDTKLPLGGMAVSHIEYIRPTMNLICILANGAILNYSLGLEEEVVLNYIDHTHIDGLNVTESIYAKPLSGFVVTSCKYAKSNLEYENYEMSKTYSQIVKSQEDSDRILFYISFIRKETNEGVACINSYLGFFGIEAYGLTYHNRIRFPKSEILDSYLYRSNNENIDDILPSYLVIATRIQSDRGKNKIQVHSSDFFCCFKSSDDSLNPFQVINEFDDDLRNILELAILSVYISPKTEVISCCNIDEYDKMSVISDKNKYNRSRYTVNVILRLLENYNNYELYLNDTDIRQRKERDANILTSDVNEYISKGYSSNECFKVEVYNTILREYRNFEITEDNRSKVDFFILLLIFNNNLSNIKIYLSKKKDKEYLVPNENIFFTSNALFNAIKLNIYNSVKSNNEDNQFFVDNKLYTSLLIIRELFKISSNRISVNYHKPFQSEENIISEDKVSITKALEEVEKIILLIRIARSYIFHIIDKEESQCNEVIGALHERLRLRKEAQGGESKLYFELIMLSDYKDIYPFWKVIFINSFIQIFNDDKDKPDGQVNMYFSKLQLFFFYYYVASEYLNYKSSDQVFTDNRAGIKKFFIEMKEEWLEYSALCFNLYRLDMGLNNLDLSVVSRFLRILNKQNLQNSIRKMNPTNIHFNSTLIKKLKDSGFKREALELSKQFIPVIHNEEDLKAHLDILLENGLINLAYQFLNYSFTFLLEHHDLSDPMKLQASLTTPEFNKVKILYFELFERLVRNGNIDLMLSLPFNFIENILIKIFLTSNRDYEEVLYLYYNKLGLCKEAVNTYSKILDNNTKIPIYQNILIDLDLLHNQKLQFEDQHRRHGNLFKVDYYINKQKEAKGVINVPMNRVDESIILGKDAYLSFRFIS